ncbi:MAG TPA: ribonuclease J, partial [Firmicutes bacterium]|nr:ribonuclease J [Bacillota bacterium]
FKTCHSIPDSVGLAITTRAGIIVYTSDFKFDQTPVDKQVMDFYKLSELGNKGVLLAITDSTNAEKPGFTPSEKEAGKNIKEIFRTATGRIIVATFASNVHRIQQVIDAAYIHKRKVAVVGRSMVYVVQIAMELGYLKVPKGTLVEVDTLNNYPLNQIVLLTTGSQGEPMSALTRISKSDHRKVSINPGDTVIISALAIPGNEKMVSKTIDNLFRLGANVIYEPAAGVHVSGHASQDELKMMLNLLKPKYVMPVHGEYRHMIHHAKLAEEVGVPPGNIFLTEIGNVLELTNNSCKINGSVASGKVLVDGLGIGDVGNIVLRDRKHLSEDGIFIVIMTISSEDNHLITGPDIVSRGFVYVRESEALLEEARELVTRNLEELGKKNKQDWSSIKNGVKDIMAEFLYKKTGRRPMILPIVIEV